MYSYLARQPIIDIDKNLFGYEILFRDGESNSFPVNTCPDQATSNILTNNHLTLGIENITGNVPAFINFHENTLIKSFPSFLDPKKVIIEILEDVPISSELIETCKELKTKGYTFALDDHDFDEKWDVLLPLVDIIKVDVLDISILKISRYVSRIEKYNLTLLAEKVETKEQFEQLKVLGFTLFQGYFFARPEMLKQKKMPTSKTAMLDLINLTSQKQLDFNKIACILEREPALTYKLLRFINSSYYGSQQEISSLKHALAYIGELELKKFLSLLALSDLGEQKPLELTRFSLVRAKFCERISEIQQDTNNPPKAYLTGMLSLIDGILDQSIEKVLDILPVDIDIKAALLEEHNYLFTYLLLAKDIEQGHWEDVSKISNTLKIESKDVYEAYASALKWADNILAN